MTSSLCRAPHAHGRPSPNEETRRRIAWAENHRYASLAQFVSSIAVISETHSPDGF
ncbi:hypothetical protein [Streptomyces sp. NPDC002573]|uniref:hypothetical protein n=1 Tax=Streptomyces sp. NPDC002573 TaxID=3364651 RepID=UPI00368BB399